jgi:hypothetical protein
MSAEYLKTIKEAHAKFAHSCFQNLKTLKTVGTKGEFRFEDSWGLRDKDPSTAPQIPVLNQLSRAMAHSPVETWVTYTYNDGNLTAELFQRIGDEPKSIQLHEDIDPDDIPFSHFSENDLLAAAHTIENHLKIFHRPIHGHAPAHPQTNKVD